MTKYHPDDELVVRHTSDAVFLLMLDDVSHECRTQCFACGKVIALPEQVYWLGQVFCEHGVPDMAVPVCRDCIVEGREPEKYEERVDDQDLRKLDSLLDQIRRDALRWRSSD